MYIYIYVYRGIRSTVGGIRRDDWGEVWLREGGKSLNNVKSAFIFRIRPRNIWVGPDNMAKLRRMYASRRNFCNARKMHCCIVFFPFLFLRSRSNDYSSTTKIGVDSITILVQMEDKTSKIGCKTRE